MNVALKSGQIGYAAGYMDLEQVWFLGVLRMVQGACGLHQFGIGSWSLGSDCIFSVSGVGAIGLRFLYEFRIAVAQ